MIVYSIWFILSWLYSRDWNMSTWEECVHVFCVWRVLNTSIKPAFYISSFKAVLVDSLLIFCRGDLSFGEITLL